MKRSTVLVAGALVAFVAVGSVGVVEGASIMSRQTATIQAQHTQLVGVHKQLVESKADADASRARLVQCAAQSAAWKDATVQESRAVQLWASQFPYGQIDLTATKTAIATAQGLNC